MWFKVRANRFLHWPEYGPVFGEAAGIAPGLVGRRDRAWAFEGDYIEVKHPAIKWCLEGYNAQMNKLVQVTKKEVNSLKGTQRRRIRLEEDWPHPIKKLVVEWTRRDKGKTAPSAEAVAAAKLGKAGVETMAGGGEVPVIEDDETDADPAEAVAVGGTDEDEENA